MTTYGSDGVRVLALALKDVPKELRPRVRSALRKAGQGVRDVAAGNASWSRRIPGALQVRTKFAGSRPGVYVVASQRVAPHARTLEGITGTTSFRHPVFGRDVWVAQATRPYLVPAVAARAEASIQELQEALDGALGTVGLK